MLRRNLVALFAMMMALWLVGCSNTESPTALTPGDDTAGGSDPLAVEELGAALDMTEDLLAFEEELYLEFGPDQGLGLTEKDGSGPGPRPQQLPQFLAALDLSEDQIAQILDYLAEVRETLPEQVPTDPQERRELCRQLHEDFMAFLETILTEDQLAVLADMCESQQQQIRDRIRDRIEDRAERVIARLTDALGLDEVQVAQLTALLADARIAAAEVMDARAAGDLTPEEARAAMLEIRDGLIDDIGAMLTEDQLALFEELLARCHAA